MNFLENYHLKRTKSGKPIPSYVKKIWNLISFLTSPLRTKPTFIIIGTPKSGTTSLFAYLLQHPQILTSVKKQTGYLHGIKPFNVFKYKRFFPLKMYVSFLEKRINKPIQIGEATELYFYDKNVPLKIEENLPNLKMILLLREPTERAISQYFHFKKNGNETRSFHETFDQLLSFYNHHSPDKEHYSPSPDHIKYSQYDKYFDNWFSFYKKGNLKIIQSELFFSDTMNVLNEIYDFLEISPFAIIDVSPFNVGMPKNIDSNIKTKLNDFFKPSIHNLNNKTGLNLFQ
jgi:hypothetical protein